MKVYNSSSLDRNALVETWLEQARGMLRNTAQRLGQDFDEIYQQAALLALELAEKAMVMEMPYAYLHRSVRLKLLRSLRGPIVTSLDAPLADDSDTTLVDLLPAQESQEDTGHVDARVRALHTALKRLPLEEQQYFRRVYELNAFTPSVWREDGTLNKADYSRTDSAMSLHGYRALRRDQQLADTIL